MHLAIAFFLIHLLLQSNFVVSQNNGNVTVGTSLAADGKGARWLSASGDFAFGFHQLEDEDGYLLSIWYDKIPEKAIVWYAKEVSPAPRGSILNLTADRGLVLVRPEGEAEEISNPVIGTITYGSMTDTGNFVLEDSNYDRLWESFNQSTDTILPGQTLGEGSMLSMLSSRRSETNFSGGRFQLNLPRTGIELSAINIPSEYKNEPYYSIGTKDNSSSSIVQMVFNQSAFIFLRGNDGQELVLSQGELGQSTKFYHRATLNYDGVFTHYRHPKNGDGGWSAVWSIPENICLHIPMAQGSGVCGYNRICRLTNDRRPDCQCPRPFSVVDPNDEYRDCIPDFLQSCENQQESEEYYFDSKTNIDWPTSDYERLEPYEEDNCKSSCLNDCMCAVAIFRSNTCYKKKLPLSNGRIDSSLNGKAFIKMRKRHSTTVDSNSPGPGKKSQSTLVILISVFLGTSVFVNFVLLGVICLGFLIIYKNKLGTSGKSEDVLHRNLRCFTYKELENSTNGFKEELGRGAFGIVYKGAIDIGTTSLAAAVKKLDRVIKEGDTEFRTEVNVIGQTHHKNLVRLLGFCAEGSNRLLVYEFLKNGTLAQFIFGDLKLTWNQRTQIAVGIARGLGYLHDECSTQIIHCDIKPQNILLDDCYSPRISDFGLAKLLRIDQSDTHTAIRGTKGYVAPEWFRNMPITVKADVYSFGVLLLEIICCRRNVDMEVDGEQAILTYWAYDCYQEGTISDLVESDSEATSDMKRLERFLMVAIWCIQEDPRLRPTMKNIVLMLEGIVEVPIPPCPSPYSTVGKN